MFDSDLSHMYFNVDSMLPKPQQFDNKLQVDISLVPSYRSCE